MDEPLDEPPAISTRPSGSRVAECWARGAVMLPLGVNAPEDCAIAIVALPKGAETRRIRNRAQKDTVTLLVMRCTTTRIIFFNPSSRPGNDGSYDPAVVVSSFSFARNSGSCC